MGEARPQDVSEGYSCLEPRSLPDRGVIKLFDPDLIMTLEAGENERHAICVIQRVKTVRGCGLFSIYTSDVRKNMVKCEQQLNERSPYVFHRRRAQYCTSLKKGVGTDDVQVRTVFEPGEVKKTS